MITGRDGRVVAIPRVAKIRMEQAGRFRLRKFLCFMHRQILSIDQDFFKICVWRVLFPDVHVRWSSSARQWKAFEQERI